jgi:hypothetical protein
VRKTGGGRVSAAAPPWTGSVCNWPNGLLARPAGRVEQVNAMVAKEEIERLRSCVRRMAGRAGRRLGKPDGAAAGLGINAARSVAAKKAIACGKGEGLRDSRR